ncbi:MAG: DUF2282 domain-containing protein [Flavobacteriales bacterium]|nr:DUF2282 domain-containing protein [Flavobacteriales bacterium]
MKDKKSIYIATAVFSAVSLAATAASAAGGHYDASMKHCYGAALAGQNDCKSDPHTCKGQSTADCSPTDWKMAKSQEECDALIAKNCPQNK